MSEERLNQRQRLVALEDDDGEASDPPRRESEEQQQTVLAVATAAARAVAHRGQFILLSEELPSVIFLRILSFLDFADRQTLNLVNKRGWMEVETYSFAVYKKIKQEHRVDDTFAARVLPDQASLDTSITGRTKPVPVPFRYRLHASLQKYLYTIDLGARDINLRHTMKISPSGGHVAISTWTDRGVVNEVVDLLTKTVQPIDDIIGGDRFPTNSHVLLFNDDRIVAYYSLDRNLHRFSKDPTTGAWHNEPMSGLRRDHDDLFVCCPICNGNGDELFFFDKDATATQPCVKSYTMNIRDGSITTNFVLHGNYRLVFPRYIAENGDIRWLVFSSGKESHDPNGGLEMGLHVYNLNSNEQTHFLHVDRDWDFLTCKQTSDCSTTFFALDRNLQGHRRMVGLWTLVDGVLFRDERSSFLVEGAGATIVTATTSHVFIRTRIGDDSYVVKCYDPNSGELKHSFGPCAKHTKPVISNARKELLSTYVAPEGGDAPSICAFCLEEPHL